MASLALMTGGSMAVATAELVNASVRPLTWVEWALYMVPPTVLLFAACTVLGARYYDVPGEVPTGAATGTDADPEGDGPPLEVLGRDQRLVLGGLVGAIVMWIVGSFVGIPTLVPAVLIVVLFSLPGVGVLDASDVRAINWGIVFLVGAMLSLLDVMRAVGAFDLVAEAFGVVVPSGAPDAVVVAAVFAVAVLVRGTFSSVSASFVVLFPVVLEGLSTTDVTPLYVSFGLTTILMAATFLPFNNPAVLVAYDRGPLDATDVFRLGLLTLTVAVGVVVLSWTVYWPFVDRAVAI
jgi:di/tricarboxylate transporter